jgi:quinol monooxygenase YgiN
MISLIFNLKTSSNKNLEFMQAIGSIIIDLRKVKGCMGIDLQQDDKDKKQFTLRLDWQNQKLITELLVSSQYEFLEGAIRVLCEVLTIEIINGHKTKITDMLKNKKTSIKKLILSELKNNLSHQN